MNKTFDISVKKGWDHTWNFNDKSNDELPIFSGRETELSRLENFLSSNRRGAIFIAGENGSGKTSTVAKLLSGREDLYILAINYIHLEGDDSKETVTSLIKQLIRALHLSLELDGDKTKIGALEDLYNKVNATTLKSSSSNMITMLFPSLLESSSKTLEVCFCNS